MAKEDEKKDKKNILHKIEQGMTVYDRDGQTVGKVDHVHKGHQGPELSYTGGGTLQGVKPGEDDFVLGRVVEEIFDPMDTLSKEIKEELYIHGFIRLLTEKLQDEERYIKPDHIKEVSEDSVHLHVSEDELKK